MASLTAEVRWSTHIDWRHVDFQTGPFADFEQFKVDSHFGDFGKVKIDPTYSILPTWAGHSCFSEFGQDIRP